MTEEQTTSPGTLRQQLIAALGLPAETFLVEFLLSDTLAPIVRCQFYPSVEAMQHAVAHLAEYTIVARPPQLAPPNDIPVVEPPTPAEEEEG